MASRVIPLIAVACVGLALWTHVWILLWPARKYPSRIPLAIM